MKRLVIYMVIVLLVSTSLAWWADNPGAVTINWLDREIHTSFAVLFFIVAFILAVGLALQSLWKWAKREMPVVGENKHLNQVMNADTLSQHFQFACAVAVMERLLPPVNFSHDRSLQ